MLRQLEEEDEVIAVGPLCPNQDCGSLVIAYAKEAHKSALWDFVLAVRR